MVQEDKRFFYLGMNQDSDPRFLKEGEYIEANNFYISSTDGGKDNSLENVKSLSNVSYTLPNGLNKCVRIQDDEENRRTYFFIWNSEGDHSILYYKYLDGTLNKLIQDNEYASSAWVNLAIIGSGSYSAGDVVSLNGRFYICLVGYTFGYTGEQNPTQNSLVWKEIGNYLNFQETNFLDSTIIIRDGQTLLFWTDNHNEPKYINVDSFIDGNYPTSVQSEHLDLCPLQPLHQIPVRGSLSVGADNNELFGKYFQFRYRWIFDDDMYGAWSPISEMYTYLTNVTASPDTAQDQLDLRVFRNSGIDSRLKKIEVAFRECRSGNIGSWYKFKEIDASESFTSYSTAPSAGANWGLTGGGVQYEAYYDVTFLNTSEALAIDQNEANQLFSFVPKKAGTIATTEDNRLVFGDIEESLDVTELVPDINFDYVYTAVSGLATTAAYLKTLKTGARYKWGIRYSDEKGRLSQVVTSDDFVKYVDFYNTANCNYPNRVSLLSEISHQPPSWAKTWQLCYTPVGISYEGSTPLAYQLLAGATTAAENPTGTTTQKLIDLQIIRTFNTDNSDSQFPLDFSDEYYVRGVYDNSAAADWAQYDESKVIEVIDSGEIEEVTITAVGSGYTTNPTLRVIGGGGDGAEITSSIGSGALVTPNIAKKGSGYTSAPTIIVDGDGTGGRAVVSKMNYKKYIKIDDTNWTTKIAQYDVIEIYKKNNDDGSGLWIEYGYPCKVGFDVNGDLAHLGRDSILFSGFAQAPSRNQIVDSSTSLSYTLDNQGDMYLARIALSEDRINYPPSKTPDSTSPANRTDLGNTYLEIPFADARVPSRSTSYKRTLTAFSGELLPQLHTTLRWSDQLIQNSNINGLGFFYDINFRELKQEYGTIRKIFAENEYLKVFFDRKMALLPMGRTELTSLNDNNSVAKTTEVFGTTRYAIPDYGVADNPESVSYFGGVTLFADRNKNSILLSSGLDIEVISDKGMKFWFDERFARTQKLATKPIIQSVYNKEFDTFFLMINDRSSCYSSLAVDNPTQITVSMTSDCVTELLVGVPIELVINDGSGNFETREIAADDWSKATANTITVTTSTETLNDPSFLYVNQGNIYTLNYSQKNQRWMSLFDLKPDRLGSSANKMISAKDGAVYVHDDADVSTYGNFYGTQYESYIDIPFAAEPTNAKNPRAIEIESTDTNFYMESGTNERGQSTSLLNADFDNIEGRQWASILMDENTPLVGGITNPITEGDLMIGTYFIARIKNSATTLVRVFSSTLRYVKSLI